jgi:hypothetical protein
MSTRQLTWRAANTGWPAGLLAPGLLLPAPQQQQPTTTTTTYIRVKSLSGKFSEFVCARVSWAMKMKEADRRLYLITDAHDSYKNIITFSCPPSFSYSSPLSSPRRQQLQQQHNNNTARSIAVGRCITRVSPNYRQTWWSLIGLVGNEWEKGRKREKEMDAAAKPLCLRRFLLLSFVLSVSLSSSSYTKLLRTRRFKSSNQLSEPKRQDEM